MQVYSHRGYHESVPENTMGAFEQAVALGVAGIETDLRLSADGLPILFHDRLAPNGAEVAALSRAELSRLVGYDVPTVDMPMDAFRDVVWMLEIKEPEALDATLAAVAALRHTPRIQITSFWHNVVARATQLCPMAECGLLVAHRPLALAPNPLGRTADMSRLRMIVWKFDTVDAAIVAESKSLGMTNFVYGVETLDDHHRTVELGVEGVISDRPEFAYAALDAHREKPQHAA